MLHQPRTPEDMTRLTVLIIHERYRESGGEDAVVAAETALLHARGHRVETLIADNRSIPERPSAWQRLALAAETTWSFRWSGMVERTVRRLQPDIVHVHNTLPLLSPAVHVAARQAGAATVQTLHNYRLVCPAATLFRDGGPCEVCLGRTIAWPALRYGCYRDSRAQSGTVAAMLAFHRARGTWRHDVDRFIALTSFARTRLLRGGLPARRTVVKPNFLEVDPGLGGGGRSFLVAGRLVPEKGIRTLIAAWRRTPSSATCRVLGGGPLEADVRAAADARVVALGPGPREAVFAELGNAAALIVPSIWYEGFPMVVVEAFARGVPVIASRIGSLAEIVEEGRTGLQVNPGDPDDLARAVGWAVDHPGVMRRMGLTARAVFEERYSAEANYPQLLDVYAAALRRRGRLGPEIQRR